MNLTNHQYSQMVRLASPGSTLLKDCLNAFWTGGLICCGGQALTELFENIIGMSLRDARTGVCISLILLSALLTTLGIYDKIAKLAGAGTLVPITGFANAVVAPAIEFRSEGAVTGMGAKMFVIAGPVIVYGTAASVLYGFFLLLSP